MKILVIGSCNVDITNYVSSFPMPGETINGLGKRVSPGGKGLNQAIALKRAGADVTFIGAIGMDLEANIIKEAIQKDSLNSYLLEKDGNTGSATILVNESSENMIVLDHGANYEINNEDLKKIRPYLEEADFILLEAELSKEITKQIIDASFLLNKKCIFNPAPAYLLDEEILSKVDYLIPNEKELLLCSGCHSQEEAVNYLLSKGVKHLLVTLGEKGSALFSLKGEIHVPAFKVKAVDTVAAGDTFIGYFLALLASGNNEETSLKIASKASAIAVTRKGAIDSIPFKKEVVC